MSATTNPVIILVRPQLGENIGTAARAMLNCGFSELRLVAPRDGWPNEKARTASSGADSVVESAKVFPTIADAVADLEVVYATAGRDYHLNLPIDTLEEGIGRLHEEAKSLHTGLLFGPERAGLESEEIVYASRIITIPLNPKFSSLNIAQAVLLTAYHFWQLENVKPHDQAIRTAKTRPAKLAEVEGMVQHVVTELENVNFYTAPDKKPSMIRNLRAMFSRMDPTEADVLTVRGIIAALVAGRRGRG